MATDFYRFAVWEVPKPSDVRHDHISRQGRLEELSSGRFSFAEVPVPLSLQVVWQPPIG
jgi:hypothetical protein